MTPAGDRQPGAAGICRLHWDEPPTPWAAGRLDARARPPRLLFGRTMEDPAVELALFPPPGPGTTVLCIASAGDTALALAAAGYEVIAVDRNPRQLEEVRRRLRDEPARAGGADRLLAAGRLALRPLGWNPSRLDRFCALTDPGEQVAEWAALTGPLVRAALGTALRPRVLRLAFGAAFAGLVPPGFGGDLLDRVHRGVARGPNRDNPWLSLLLTGRWTGDPPENPARLAQRIDLREGDVAAVLASLPPGSLAGVSLSNVLDGPGDDYRRHLLGAARGAAAPGGVVLSRTFFDGARPAARARAALDRSLLWGAIDRLVLSEPR